MLDRKGFTLLELVVVIIIIGILASLGLNQYGQMVERSRGAEAKAILGQVRGAAAAHYMQYNALTGMANTNENFTELNAGLGTQNDQVPNAGNCRASHYFSYGFAASAGNSPVLTVTATRCGSSGKGGASATATGRTLLIRTSLPAGTDVWSGTGGY